jgi:hypothetical protein
MTTNNGEGYGSNVTSIEATAASTSDWLSWYEVMVINRTKGIDN